MKLKINKKKKTVPNFDTRRSGVMEQKEIEEVSKIIRIDLGKNREKNRKELRRRMETYQRRFLKDVMKKEKS